MKIHGTESNKYIAKELGNRIRDIRIGRSMTREDLSLHAGVSLSTVTRLETGGNVSLDNFLKVLYSLNCLQNIDLLIPEQEITPKELFHGTQKRIRASKKKTNTNWTWGDET